MFLQIMKNWSKEYKLNFSTEKCNYTMIKRGENIIHILLIELYSLWIPVLLHNHRYVAKRLSNRYDCLTSPANQSLTNACDMTYNMLILQSIFFILLN